MRTAIGLAILLAALIPVAGSAADPGTIAQYTADYEVRYKGRRVARAQFGVTADQDSNFIFNSTTQARGIWRMAAPDPAIEWSRFALQSDGIQPLEFRYQDGSRKGEDNYSLVFDASAAEIRLSAGTGDRSIPFEPAVLDRGSLQVALMQALSMCTMPRSYRYIDDDGTINAYAYERLEDLPLETELGTLDTIRLSQHREGSSRVTVLWMSPAHAYVPVRIEQIRNGETETVFSIEALSEIEGATAPCSSFR